MIRLELTEHQKAILVDAIESYLSDLRMEISDTDSMDYREMLKNRKEVLGQILENLGAKEEMPLSGHR